MMLKDFYTRWLSPQHWLERCGVRPPMQIVLGLVLLTLSVLLFANAFHLVPTDAEASLRARTVLAKLVPSVALSSINADDKPGAQRFLDSIVKKYGDVLSIGLRQSNGSILIQTAGHETYWRGAAEHGSTPTHMRVLLYSNHKPTGAFEIAFRPLEAATWRAWLSARSVRLTVFILSATFVLFWLFLSRMLRMLDPSAAVPERTQQLMDTLVEGIVIVDSHDQIVMSNQSFAQTAFLPLDRLIGRALSSLPWSSDVKEQTPPEFPWRAVQRSGLPHRGVTLHLQVGTQCARRLNVNASPILDPHGTQRGVLVTFNDQTIVEADNHRLHSLIMEFAGAKDGLGHLRAQYRSADEDDELAKLDELVTRAREMAGTCESAATNPAAAKSEYPIPEAQ